MKRERMPVSQETQNQLIGYLFHNWHDTFVDLRSILMSGKVEACKPLTKGPWTYTARGKEYPLLRMRVRTRKFVIEPFGIKGWRLTVVNMNNILGLRVHKRRHTRWMDVNCPKALEELSQRFINTEQIYHYSISNETFHDEVSDHTIGGYAQIRYSVCIRTGKGLMDAESSTIQRWLINDIKVKKDSKGMSGLTNLLSRLLADERPDKGGVKILSGPEILQAYAREDGAHSCMTGRAHTAKIEFYALNTKNCMLAVIYNNLSCAGSPVARLIVWKQMEGDTEVWFPDRVYPPNTKSIAKARVALSKYVEKKKNVVLRWFREEGYENPDDRCWADDADYRANEGGEGAKKEYSPVLKLKLPESMIMPYMDTMAWAQVLSDGDGLFARTSKRLLSVDGKVNKNCPIELADGVHVLCKPIQMINTDGGKWKPLWKKCNCGNNYNGNPPEAFGNRYATGYWSVNICNECFDKKYVTPWTYYKLDGIPYHSVEIPRLKTECKWSKNLDSWVHSEGNNAHRYLIWDKTDKDWYLHNDPRWAKKKEAHGEHPETTKNDVTSPPASNIVDPDTESEEERRRRQDAFLRAYGGNPDRVTATEVQNLQQLDYHAYLYGAPPPPQRIVAIQQPDGTMRNWNEDQLRTAINEYQRGCSTQSRARQTICRQMDSGLISTVVYREAMSRHTSPDMSAYAFGLAEWSYALHEGWVHGAIPTEPTQGDNP